jgi:hypothetical protein
VFKISYDKKITMVQGDTGVINMKIHNYELSQGDEVRFAIVNKANPSILLCQHSDKKIVLEKQVTVFEKDGSARIVIYPYDTEYLQPGKYLYEIQVKTKDGRIDTVVPLASFTLMDGSIQGEFGQTTPSKPEPTPSEIELRFTRLENEIIPELGNRITNVEKEIDSVNSSLDNIILEVTPRMTDGDLQKAVDLAVTLGVNKLKLEAIGYELTDTLLIPSNFTIEGVKGKTVISLKGVNKPVIGKKGSLSGNTHIANLTVSGDKEQPNNDGIYLNDYYSSVTNCDIVDCGRHGIYFANGSASSTLVENKFKNIVFRRCMGYSFKADDGNKCSDATLEDILINGTSGALGGIHIGSAAGWFISKVHTYSYTNVCPFVVYNSYNTNIDNIYIENSGSIAMDIGRVQQSCNINNITIMRSANMKNGIYINKSTATNFTAIVNINNDSVVNNIDSDFTMINTDASDVTVNTNNITRQGVHNSRIKLLGDNVKNSASYIKKIQIDGTLKGVDSTLYLNDIKFSPYVTKKWSGSGEKSIVVKLNKLESYIKMPFTISIFSQKWDTQGAQVKYCATGLISCGSSITSREVTTLELGSSAGLSKKPSYSINTETLEITIKFTPSATDGSDQGVLFMQFGY